MGNRRDSHPGTVMMQLTRLWLCRGSSSKVRTTFVRLAIPRPAILEPVTTPPVVIIAAPPAPARNDVVPVTPTVVNAAPRPAPITGARRPAERPITSPPPDAKVNYPWFQSKVKDAPMVARPIITIRFLLAAFAWPSTTSCCCNLSMPS
jgi:hypothetical protein